MIQISNTIFPGKWRLVASLTEGRHYHGLTSMGLRPMVFGGWNNGSMSSYELLDFGQVAETLSLTVFHLNLSNPIDDRYS